VKRSHTPSRALHPPLTPPGGVGAHCYSELAAHQGHELHIVIYGGGQSAAVECERCRTALAGFARHPDAQSRALAALAEHYRIQPDDLQPAVVAVAQDAAESLTDQGVDAQIAYLLTAKGKEARALVEQAASEGGRL